MRITILGSSAALPTVERGVSALMLQREGELLLFDCGEGTQRQMMRYGVGFGCDDIFITHYHADHTLGIPGLLRTFGLQGRTAPLRLHGPSGAKRHLGDLISLGMERVRFPVEINELAPGDELKRNSYRIVVGEATHKGPCLSYALIEDERLGRFDPELARTRGIPEGPLWGKLHRGEVVTLPTGESFTADDFVGPARPGRKVVYSGDTMACRATVLLAQNADLLIHEATFGEDERDRARDTFHSTARDAATTARDAGVGRLVLTHLSARYSREAPELLAEAQAVFGATQIARDGLVVEVPFADGGL